jgi:anti-anti-sigma factor
MVNSYFTQWFPCPAACMAPSHDPEEGVPIYSAPRALRFSPTVSPVQVAVSGTLDDVVIRVKGEATAESVGALLAGLLAPSACRPAVVTLDLSELRSISCLAMGVLVSYRRSVVRTGGRVRLTGGLQPRVKESLTRAELLHLFDPTEVARPASDRAGDVIPPDNNAVS